MEVNFNNLQRIEVIFYHFYKGRGGLEVSTWALVLWNAGMDSAKWRK